MNLKRSARGSGHLVGAGDVCMYVLVGGLFTEVCTYVCTLGGYPGGGGTRRAAPLKRGTHMKS
jgi:hypothetical protein